MQSTLKAAAVAGLLALAASTGSASAAPVSSQVATINQSAGASGLVEEVHWRRWRHCHWVRRCWVNDWGVLKCRRVLRCHRRGVWW